MAHIINKEFEEGSLDSKMNYFSLCGNQHPLLIPLIVQKVLEYCKFVILEDNNFYSLRLVCKLWDDECGKFLRKETEIPVPKLLEPYPGGLGWAENECDSNTGLKYQFHCPFPTTKEFYNFKFTASCESSMDKGVIKWFSAVGKQVKSLRFICALTCFHQNDFLANVLHKWCTNLETLHLDGIQCFSSLIFIFGGKWNGFRSFKDIKINCKNLKNLTISVESDENRKNCTLELGLIPIEVFNAYITNLRQLMSDFKEMTDLLPEKDLSFRPEINKLFHHLIESNNPDILSNILEKYTEMVEVDWGVLGLVLKSAPIQKLVIKKLASASQTQHLVLFLLTHQSKLRTTLKHLEFQNASLSRFCLKVLSLLKCSLSTLRIDELWWRNNAAKHLHDILKTSAETLTTFVIGLKNIIYFYDDQKLMNVLQIPLLPNLKSFTNNSIGLLYVNGVNLLQNCPNLESCCIAHLQSETNGTKSHILACEEALKLFCAKLDHPSVKEHALKELKINVGLQRRHISLLCKGLSNLLKVELKIFNPIGFILGYYKSDGWRKIQSLRLSIWKERNIDNEHIGNVENGKIFKCFENLKTLKFFELTFRPTGIEGLPIFAFTNGFAKLHQLTSLKLNNMCIFLDEKDEIDQSTAHIPFVSFLKPMLTSREDYYARCLYWHI